MHFIFPKNYDFKPKLLGIIDYSTVILDSIIGFSIYTFLGLFISNVMTKLYVFICVFLPILLFSILGINKESFISVFIYMFKFIKRRNVYLFSKLH